ncbi:hypothetical protein bcere0004_56950 [Bacillus cereus BGSC 6E1]|nr:hypothetical protein bcere0004_56950 [Bacillus cereus BGSC 6E1]
MMRVAYHHDPKKKLKPSDLFDRNKLNGENNQDLTIEEKMQKAQEHMQFLQTLNFN